MCGVPTRVSWNERDKFNLAQFLTTQSGQRFINIIRNSSVDVTQKSVWVGGSPERARGWQECFNHIVTLAAFDPLKLAEHDGQVSLVDSKTDMDAETQEAQTDESASEEYGFNGSSIGIR